MPNAGLVTIRRTEAFVAAYDAREWRRAATQLGVTRAAIWQLNKEFAESLCGAKPDALFVRSGDGRLRPTELADKLIGPARALVGGAEALRQVARPREGPVRLGCFPAHVPLVAPLLARGESHLRIVEAEDELREARGRELLDRVAGHSLDLAIAPTQERTGLEQTVVCEWSLRCVVASSFRPRLLEPVDPAALTNHRLLVSPHGHISREHAERSFAAAGVALAPTYEGTSTESLLALVDAGYGIAILPSDAVWPRPGRRVLALQGEDPGGSHSLFWRRGTQRQDPRLATIIASLRVPRG